jgi:hypothetical protein
MARKPGVSSCPCTVIVCCTAASKSSSSLSALSASVQFISLGYSRQSMNLRPIFSSLRTKTFHHRNAQCITAKSTCHSRRTAPNIPAVHFRNCSNNGPRAAPAWTQAPSWFVKNRLGVLASGRSRLASDDGVWARLLSQCAELMHRLRLYRRPFGIHEQKKPRTHFVPRGHSLYQPRLFGLKRWGLGGWGTASVTPSYRSNLHAAEVAEVTRITKMQVVHSAEEPGCASPVSSAFLEQETPSAGLSVALGARSETAGQVDGLLTIPPDKSGARVVGRHHRNFNRALIPGSRDLFFVKAKPQYP